MSPSLGTSHKPSHVISILCKRHSSLQPGRVELSARRLFALSSPILEDVPYRACAVSFTDSEGVQHSVQVSAASLYEAAAEALAAFRQGSFCGRHVRAGDSINHPRESAGGRTHRDRGEAELVA
jgi:hypothetical protein